MRILVANRGEIAHRIIKTLKSLHFEIVVIYHEDEKNAIYISEADIAVNIGDGSLQDTFLNISLLIKVANEHNCDALHPGYGFLSENHLLAKACEENNIKFIGPSSEVIRIMGSKVLSKDLAVACGLPVMPYQKINTVEQVDFSSLDFPVLIKASGGGGGKGMQICGSQDTFHMQFDQAKRESLQYFGSDEMLVESYLENARHIEVQIFGDDKGNVIHLFDRECSIQRNHQKIIEEAPVNHLENDLRQIILDSAIRLAKKLKYTNAGTVEFLVQGNNYYFLEMNTRIQVEHPVTELITGVDIVAEQINIAMGNSLPEYLHDIKLNGHAIEARIYAEDPYNNFMPSVGTIHYCIFPKDIRVDTFIQSPTQITPLFDSLFAKIIVHAENRPEAINKLHNTLEQSVILGINTNIDYLYRILSDNIFKNNNHNSRFLEIKQNSFNTEFEIEKNAFDVRLLAIAFILNNFVNFNNHCTNLWQKAGVDFRYKFYSVFIDSKEIILSFLTTREGFVFKIDKDQYSIYDVIQEGSRIEFKTETGTKNFYFNETKDEFDFYQIDKKNYKVSCPHLFRMAEYFINKKNQDDKNKVNQIVSPLFGKVIDIKVNVQDIVKKGDILLTIESMKTENHIVSPNEGIIEQILVQKGDQVKENVKLLTLNPL